MESVDAILMGRKTMDVVLGFDGPWPYSKPVFVLSSSISALPGSLAGKAEIVSGDIHGVVERLNDQGFTDIYIDGGKLIQNFLAEDMIDELIVTQVPILIGGGTLLFGDLPDHMQFELISSEVLLKNLVQSHYRRKR